MHIQQRKRRRPTLEQTAHKAGRRPTCTYIMMRQGVAVGQSGIIINNLNLTKW